MIFLSLHFLLCYVICLSSRFLFCGLPYLCLLEVFHFLSELTCCFGYSLCLMDYFSGRVLAGIKPFFFFLFFLIDSSVFKSLISRGFALFSHGWQGSASFYFLLPALLGLLESLWGSVASAMENA